MSGPKNADCVPIRNRIAIRKGTLPEANAATPSAMTTISASLTRRISSDFSCLSAISPAKAENRKNGRMNSPAARLMTSPSPPLPAAPSLTAAKATSATSAFL